ncbi:MAG: polysaccharide pyruvyl transferase family protein [Methylicorpusculum sp.]|uniref:polysaccharide pyruvyl transferase family protein n=1 Tax=Methylicorpusculum sp. TaxID=2713644 RepID=UPI002716D51C|nr:polysaccharide pyruvyl transferase family protein [Methylicorpusculum sp.]MDO8941096.1 polysaccharide pyruvyl transferase family protein [Methylicorpusculum sp.]
MTQDTRPQLTIGLLWHSFSSDNLGVGALSVSQLAICEAAAAKAGVELCFIVFGTEGLRNYAPTDRNIKFGPMLSFKELLTGRSQFIKYLLQCDLILDIGEGDSFADIYGLRRFRFHIVSKLLAIYKGIPLILSPQTIGPFEKWYTRWLSTWVMRRCTKIFPRDNLSSDYLQNIGITTNVTQAIDVAFRLPYSTSKLTEQKSERIQIGLNVSGLLFSGGYEGANQFGLSLDYPQLIRNLLSQWHEDSKLDIWLIPHVLSDRVPRDDDRIAIAQLVREYPQVMIAPEFKSPSEAKSFISGLDFMTGARMHACIAALSSGVPVVPLAYSRKFNGLFTSLNYPWLADGKVMSNEKALLCITSGLENRSELRRVALQAIKKADDLLVEYERYLTQLFIATSNSQS